MPSRSDKIDYFEPLRNLENDPYPYMVDKNPEILQCTTCGHRYPKTNQRDGNEGCGECLFLFTWGEKFQSKL